MVHPADPAAPGRIRRLVLTVASPLLIFAPLLIVALYGEHLPDRAYLDGWEGSPAYAPTWDGWASMHRFTLVYMEVTCVALFLHYWRWPELQRWVATGAFAFGLSRAASNALDMVTLLDAPGPVPVSAWRILAELAIVAVAVLLGRLLAGPLPAPSEASTAPPRQAPALALTPESRAMFAVSTWSWRKLRKGTMILLLMVLAVSVGAGGWQSAVGLGLLAVFEMLQVRTRLQIDGTGVEVTLPWLGRLRRAVPYTVVSFAEVRPAESGARLGLIGGSRGWGYVNNRSPVLALKLTDGREFLYSTRDAETAAALVNGSLNRARQR
jgi:hypothetical protein